MWELFSKRFSAVNGTPLSSAGDLAQLLRRNSWLYGYCDPQLWPLFREALAEPFTVETSQSRESLLKYDFGITRAFGAIAETGTLILTDSGTSSRLAALAPWVHVAVLDRRDILADIPAALVAHPRDPNIVWVTGPSKTADVEGIMIEGVHGPGVQIALLSPAPA
jgi:L-lactate dehydrogenase complex protein LldG